MLIVMFILFPSVSWLRCLSVWADAGVNLLFLYTQLSDTQLSDTMLMYTTIVHSLISVSIGGSDEIVVEALADISTNIGQC